MWRSEGGGDKVLIPVVLDYIVRCYLASAAVHRSLCVTAGLSCVAGHDLSLTDWGKKPGEQTLEEADVASILTPKEGSWWGDTTSDACEDSFVFKWSTRLTFLPVNN